MVDRPKSVSVRLTEDQYNLARRRMFIEDLNWQQVLRALVNAYVMGDVSVTNQGRYHLAPPSGYRPVIQVEKQENIVEIEPEWGVTNGRPQVGATHKAQHPQKKIKWGTREAAAYLREETGRKITHTRLRDLLNVLEIPKKEGSTRWEFEGPEDKHFPAIINAIENGILDTLIRDSFTKARIASDRRKQDVDTFKASLKRTEMERRARHLQRLRDIEK